MRPTSRFLFYFFSHLFCDDSNTISREYLKLSASFMLALLARSTHVSLCRASHIRPLPHEVEANAGGKGSRWTLPPENRAENVIYPA